MLNLDADFLARCGLSRLPGHLSESALRIAYAVLERRTGLRIAGLMTDDEMDEFEALMHADDDGAALAWLDQHLPDYRAIVVEEFRNVEQQLTGASSWLYAALLR